MAQLHSIIEYLDSLLEPQSFNDVALNGLQLESSAKDVRKVAVAVDSGTSVIKAAIAQEAQLLIVHHGLFWGSVQALTGSFGKKIDQLFSGDCSLYAAHLPLDAHREVGNAFELGRFLSLDLLESFFEYRGTRIGARGKLAKARSIDYFIERTKEMPGAKQPLVLPFGPQQIKTVGILTGSGSSAIMEAAGAKLDLLVTGEPKQEAYHLAQELKLNVLFAGHYATETFGVRALGQRLKKDFDIDYVFIDEPTGI